MKIIAFDIRGKTGHFRRPDTTGAHLTYPFITRTVTHGLIASVLGMEKLEGEAWIGIQLCSPVKSRSQELSMLGKGWLGGGDTFNRPTSVELVVKPHYRIYYAGDFGEKLEEMLKEKKSHYHTYLGSAYCLTFPEYIDSFYLEELYPPFPEKLSSYTVVPVHAIETLSILEGAKYGRVGGMHYDYLGDRKFNGTINIVYDYEGKIIVFEPKPIREGESNLNPFRFFKTAEGEVICLW
ncbi:CRISPR-associated protein Cas5 [Candidatus Contubernalis alkaliaceticus]|uniref:CRISPR-associated protein Cas5 n=1 Tax=Candidatus Contubernalis alkaliaceticus TaxID=338645 RepID=UPI001F4BF158|nr:CRISPR-associated protein Cas5 [Candidatus Contubernalis alkalaceticus]UNC93173.1 CRISPR-associated protein Cas5 [Candidatus Contubernalis alkalaceticus]